MLFSSVQNNLIVSPNNQDKYWTNIGGHCYRYRKDIEHLYHAFVYSPVSFLSGIYPLPAMHSLLVTLYYLLYRAQPGQN